MSGFCGLACAGGMSRHVAALARITGALAFRGPDASSTWVGEGAGLGHCLLRVGGGEPEQPLSLDGRVWLACDARIDGKDELRTRLAGCGQACRPDADDAELILLAYRAWGISCLEYMIGDFAFALWDEDRQQLFCVRDQLGIKPVFFAPIGDGVVVGNTLEALRLHPEVSSELDELSIADHLIFEFVQDPNATAFAQIRRLGPGQFLLWTPERLELKTWWRRPEVQEIVYRREEEYGEHFRSLMDVAISDRLGASQVAVEMSGGLDSTSVAALAKCQMERSGQPYQLSAYTMVFDRLFEDPERTFATAAASHIGIPIHFSIGDDFGLFEPDPDRPQRRPEPFHNPVPRMETCTMASVPASVRVVLTGWDGDSLLNESPKPYFRWLFRRGQWLRLGLELARFCTWQRRIVPRSWRDRLLAKPGSAGKMYMPTYPAWLNPDLESRLQLRERWQHFQAEQAPAHPFRPAAYRKLSWLPSAYFDTFDAGITGRPLEFRHPFLDLRVAEFCLSLPPTPWCFNKEILRRAMKGMLPESVLTRPKTSLRAYPDVLLLQQPKAAWIDKFVAFPALGRYVVREKIPKVAGVDDPNTWTDTRPLSLNQWLGGQLQDIQMRKMQP